MHTYNVEKMFTYLRGFFNGAMMSQSMMALGFAREKHAGQVRRGNGQPYIVHPLSMACYALSIGIRDDTTIAAVLLHDVPEDTGTPLSSLPVSDTAREIVDCMTVKPEHGESKWKCKERYFHNLLKQPGAVICKGLDRYSNLSTMAGEMPVASIEKNVVETSELLLPVMREAKERWPQLSDHLHTLRNNIRSINDTLDAFYGISERKNEIIRTMMETPAIKNSESDHGRFDDQASDTKESN